MGGDGSAGAEHLFGKHCHLLALSGKGLFVVALEETVELGVDVHFYNLNFKFQISSKSRRSRKGLRPTRSGFGGRGG